MDLSIKTVDEYINKYPNDVQKILVEIREIVKKVAPNAVESINYGMPAYKTYSKPLVYFAAYEHHIGFYATPTCHEEFAKELSKYKQGKGSVQFPINQTIPFELIRNMTIFKAEENEKKFKK
jgi:uncharacterized protein YdhG (YjbR/CyaY superfamily)